MATLQELSLAGCEQLTALGLRSLGGLTRMRRLSLQTCNQVRWAQPVVGKLADRAGWIGGAKRGTGGPLPLWPLSRQLLHALQLLLVWSLTTSTSNRPLPRSGLAQLYRLQLLEALDLGWCRAVGDADAAALGRLPLLRELNLARTQVFGMLSHRGLLGSPACCWV